MKDLIFAAVLFISLTAAAIGSSHFLSTHFCSSTAEVMGKPYVYTWATGCMVKVKGEWIPLKNLRAEME